MAEPALGVLQLLQQVIRMMVIGRRTNLFTPPKNGCLEDVFPVEAGLFLGDMLLFWGVNTIYWLGFSNFFGTRYEKGMRNIAF